MQKLVLTLVLLLAVVQTSHQQFWGGFPRWGGWGGWGGMGGWGGWGGMGGMGRWGGWGGLGGFGGLLGMRMWGDDGFELDFGE